MRIISLAILTLIMLITASCNYIKVIPINHGTFALKVDDNKFIIDPVGNYKIYDELKNPEVILLTDIHGDHLDIERLKKTSSKQTTIIGPLAVASKLKGVPNKEIITLSNGKTFQYKKITIEAMPMYNLTPGRLKYHKKGRGNGYLLQSRGKSVYISGDTEDIPEMRNLEDIDMAFISMNLPYTMTIEQAASATLEFKPKKVYPYHYRGKKDGKPVYSDVDKFKEMVTSKNQKIKVHLLDWY